MPSLSDVPNTPPTPATRKPGFRTGAGSMVSFRGVETSLMIAISVEARAARSRRQRLGLTPKGAPERSGEAFLRLEAGVEGEFDQRRRRRAGQPPRGEG
jgi:hypothetical protein